MEIFIVTNMTRDDNEIHAATLGAYTKYDKAKAVYDTELETTKRESSWFQRNENEYGHPIEDRSGRDYVVTGIAFGDQYFFYELIIEKRALE